MWHERDYGNQSEAGGFLNSTTNQSDTPAKKTGGRRLQSVVPVVIRQIRDCPEDDFKLFGFPTQILHLVGILKDYEVQSTKATYRIEDHTGEIKAIWWLENDSDNTPNLPPVKEGNYVQVFGSIRNQEGGRIIMVLKMFPVEDCNMVTNHLLQVVHARLAYESMSKSMHLSIKKHNPGVALANTMSFIDENISDQVTGLTPIQQKVMKILETNSSATGLSRQFILKHFPNNQSREVNDALEFLNNEGHAFSTIDSDHFKATTDI